MTITVEYSAVKTAFTGQTAFTFPWECLGLQALEVWAETETDTPGTYDRVQLAPQEYYVVFGGGAPTFLAGTVTLTGAIASTVDRISIERNTPITQLADLKNFGPFKMPTLEFMLDKMVMIIQELAYRKCGFLYPDPIAQPYRFDEYTVLSATVVDAALLNVTTLINAILTGGTDCRTNPEGA
jgi:hypothetical protein